MSKTTTLVVSINEELLHHAITVAEAQPYPTDLSWLMAGITEAVVAAVTNAEPTRVFHDGRHVGQVSVVASLGEAEPEQQYAEPPREWDATEWVQVQAEVIHTDEGVTFTPMSLDGGIGYDVTEDTTGRVEHVFLMPSTGHDITVEDGGTADTFLYLVDASQAEAWQAEQAGPGTGLSLVELAESIGFVNHYFGATPEQNTPGT